jgi:hypothetical protein
MRELGDVRLQKVKPLRIKFLKIAVKKLLRYFPIERPLRVVIFFKQARCDVGDASVVWPRLQRRGQGVASGAAGVSATAGAPKHWNCTSAATMKILNTISKRIVICISWTQCNRIRSVRKHLNILRALLSEKKIGLQFRKSCQQ